MPSLCVTQKQKGPGVFQIAVACREAYFVTMDPPPLPLQINALLRQRGKVDTNNSLKCQLYRKIQREFSCGE